MSMNIETIAKELERVGYVVLERPLLKKLSQLLSARCQEDGQQRFHAAQIGSGISRQRSDVIRGDVIHCEIDHLISRELGGADEINNLWPQAYGTSPWNAVLKDTLENRLHKELCAGKISLKKARDLLVNHGNRLRRCRKPVGNIVYFHEVMTWGCELS